MRYWIFGLASLLFAGCGGSGGTISKKAGEAVGQSVTDFGKGLGSGVDKAAEIKVELSDAVKKAGISQTVAKQAFSNNKKGVTMYLLSQSVQQVTLVSKALNSNKQEIGRSTVDVSFSKDDAQYVSFYFDSEMDSMQVEVFTLDIKAP